MLFHHAAQKQMPFVPDVWWNHAHEDVQRAGKAPHHSVPVDLKGTDSPHEVGGDQGQKDEASAWTAQ